MQFNPVTCYFGPPGGDDGLVSFAEFQDMMLNDQDRGLETMTKITGAAMKRMSSAGQ